MQLKLKRSQRDGGVISKNVIFCLDARAAYTAQERDSIRRYKLHNEIIYSSDKAKRLFDKGERQLASGETSGGLKATAAFLMARLQLNVTVASLEKGHHIECKSLDELLAAEDALYDACKNVRKYLDLAATFDGREVLVDFSVDEPAIIAQAVSPSPVLVTHAPQAIPPAPVADPIEHAAFEDVSQSPAPEPPPADDEDRRMSLADPDLMQQLGRRYRSLFGAGYEGESRMFVISGLGGVGALMLLLYSCS